MFKRLLNECKIELTLYPKGAMLIKSGIAQVTGVDMAWVRVYRNGRDEVYLPGSSLKGTIRSHAERIARTLNEKAACNPFETKKDSQLSCSERIKKKFGQDIPATTAYKHSCPICRLFGNTWLMGRLATEDAYVPEGNDGPAPQQRDGVGIDRFTGGAARGAKFELEVITEGEFETTLHLQNFEIWQLGLLGFVLHDLKDGMVRMGSGKSRGMGKVEAEIGEITVNYVGGNAKIAENGHVNLLGAGALYERAHEEYGMQANDGLQIDRGNIEVPEPELAGLRQTARFTFENFPWQQVAERWLTFLGSFTDELRRGRS